MLSRPYTPEELAVIESNLAQEALRLEIRNIITQIKVEKDVLDADFIDPNTGLVATNSVINAAPAKYIKANKKALERTMRAVIDIAKLLDN